MKIVADEAIPLVDYYFSSVASVILKPGRAIERQDLIDADGLLVRTVTPVNRTLLENTRVKWVGSVMSGMDHLDLTWLKEAGIEVAVAEGCNSTAVVEYFLCLLAAIQREGLLGSKPLRAGVIGVGRIGTKVASKLKKLGMEVIQHDPPRSLQQEDFVSSPLRSFVDLDLITIHTPLAKTGPYPTFHLIDKSFLQQQKKGCVLINTSRGSVINFADLLQFGKHVHWCLDVFENEPNIDLKVLFHSLIATPHIAGHTIQSKYRGIKMIYQAALEKQWIPDKKIKEFPYPTQVINFSEDKMDWQNIALQIYDPKKTSNWMKSEINHYSFDYLREHFAVRHEFQFIHSDFLKYFP